ncbi:MAG TPA: hypothetical protein PL124_11590, partial [Candidatus Cloacimonadota bacterium]|nr:hypothetical protein [Candidatus Cloacimonadota bacterium]
KGKTMSQQHAYQPHTSMSNLMDGQLIAQYINSDINSERYAQAKHELEKRRYRLEQIILQMNNKGKK